MEKKGREKKEKYKNEGQKWKNLCQEKNFE